MIFSTSKKVIALTMIMVLGFTAVSNAQQDSSFTANSTPKIFGGRTQYRTWSVGFNVGSTAPSTLAGGVKDYAEGDLNLGYGLSVRKQLAHSFGLEFGLGAAKLSGSNGIGGNLAYETKLAYTASLSGVVNVATVDFLKRENAVNFLVKAGYGIAGYSYKITNALNVATNYQGTYGASGTKKYAQDKFIPVGVGAKFKVSNRVNFDLGYTMNFINTDNVDGTVAPGNDSWSYTSAGLEFSLGAKNKPNLDWVNPIALMYDELKDPALRKELEALKQRVNTLEAADLLKDSDGDGVADKLDKCPNTEAGIKVDGAGCPLDTDNDGVPDSKDSCPTEKGTVEFNGCPGSPSSSANAIQFEFNSSVLKTSSYPILDQLSNDLRSKVILKVELGGHASEEGTTDYNLQLSKDRANAVKTYLVNSGVAASKIVTKGFGETRPVASNATEEGRQLNRRVEVVR